MDDFPNIFFFFNSNLSFAFLNTEDSGMTELTTGRAMNKYCSP